MFPPTRPVVGVLDDLEAVYRDWGVYIKADLKKAADPAKAASSPLPKRRVLRELGKPRGKRVRRELHLGARCFGLPAHSPRERRTLRAGCDSPDGASASSFERGRVQCSPR